MQLGKVVIIWKYTVVGGHRVQNGRFAESFGEGHKGHGRFLD